jgi:FKBP-type peptidyl-prolyl cis-trans isomerase
MKRQSHLLLLAVSLILVAVGCGESGEGDKEKDKDLIKTDSGLKYKDLKVGEGAAAKMGDSVLVHYTGRLTNGKQFDSSVGKDPLEFTLGAGRVIKGWEEGIRGMKTGGKRKLVIPPELAYGKRGYPPDIPADATLVFEVELVKIQ